MKKRELPKGYQETDEQEEKMRLGKTAQYRPGMRENLSPAIYEPEFAAERMK